MAFKPNYGRDRGRHVLGAMKKCERETRKLRCAKPSAPKSSRRRMKPILDWTKSKAAEYDDGPGLPSDSHSDTDHNPADKPANIQVTTSAPVSRSFNAR